MNMGPELEKREVSQGNALREYLARLKEIARMNLDTAIAVELAKRNRQGV